MTEQKTDPQATPTTLTAEQQSIVDGLIRCQQESRNADGDPKSDDEFGKSLVPPISGSKWNMIRNGKYWTKVDDLESLFTKLKKALNQSRLKNMRTNRFNPKEFFNFDFFKSVFTATQKCLNKPLGELERCIVVLGETGMGKSATCAELTRRFKNVIVVESRDKWRTSKFVALKDICEAAELSTEGICDPSKLEDMLGRLFSSDQYILAIDEAEAMSSDLINTYKRFINQTRLVIVFFTYREAYEKWVDRFKQQAKHLINRIHVVLEYKIITTDEAVKFLEPYSVNGERKEIAKKLAMESTQFGGLRFIKRVLKGLTPEKEFTLIEVTNQITIARAEMGGVK